MRLFAVFLRFAHDLRRFRFRFRLHVPANRLLLPAHAFDVLKILLGSRFRRLKHAVERKRRFR